MNSFGAEQMRRELGELTKRGYVLKANAEGYEVCFGDEFVHAAGINDRFSGRGRQHALQREANLQQAVTIAKRDWIVRSKTLAGRQGAADAQDAVGAAAPKLG